MSLLQEALKRKEQDESPDKPAGETAANVAATTPADPPDSPPQSMPVLNEPQAVLRRKTSVLWVIVAVIAIFVTLTVAAGFVYFFYRLWPVSKARVVQTVPRIAPAAAPALAIPSAGTNQADARPAAKPAAAADVKQTPVGAEASAPAAALTNYSQTSAVPQQAAGVNERKPVSAKPSFLKAKQPAAIPAVKWPLLKLSGILSGSGNNKNTALINGKMVNTGQTIENAVLIEIQSDGVILKYGEETRFLRVGAVSY
jgi:hypothetical protein